MKQNTKKKKNHPETPNRGWEENKVIKRNKTGRGKKKLTKTALVSFHVDTGSSTSQAIVIRGSKIVSWLHRGSATVCGGGQGGFADLVLALVEQNVGSIGLQRKRKRWVLLN